MGRVAKNGVVVKRGGWEIFERENSQKKINLQKM